MDEAELVTNENEDAAAAQRALGDVGKLDVLMRLLPAVHAAGEKVVIVAQFQRCALLCSDLSGGGTDPMLAPEM